MRRFLFRAGATVVAAAALVSALPAPAASQPAPEAPIDAAIASVYDVISGPAGERDWDRFRSLFVDGARLISMQRSPEGEPFAASMTVEEYIERAGASFRDRPFYERELARHQEVYGAIAHAFSTYATYTEPNGEPTRRGVNSIQLAREGAEWKIVTILWDAEREGQPIPQEYLPD